MRSGATVLVMLIALASGAQAGAAEPKGPLLESVNWRHFGAALRDLHASVPAILKSARLNGPLPAEEVARCAFAPLLAEFVDPATLTRPAVVTRALTMTLAASEAPLGKHQRVALAALARTYEERETRRVESYGADTWELTKLLQAARLRDRFGRDVRALLSEEQTAALCPERAAGRLWLCPFTSAPLFLRRVRVLRFADRSDLTEQLLAILVPALGLTPAERHGARIHVSRYLNAIPDAELLAEVDDLDRRGLVTAGRATAWGRRTAALLARLADGLVLDEKRVARVRRFGVVLVPLATPAK